MEHFLGMQGFVWWMGILENRIDPLKTGRAQIRIFGWNSPSKSLLPTDQLIWAHPMLPLNSDSVSLPTEGKMVFGFFMDGDSGQYPVMMGQLPGIPDTKPDASQGFADPRTPEQLQEAPRPPASVNYDSSGTGAVVTEAQAAQNYPSVLNEPTSSRITRNENIEQTIVGQKQRSTISDIPVGTGSISIPGVDVEAVLSLQLSLPSLTIPPISAGINIGGSFEICGVSISASLSAAFAFGGLSLSLPTINIDGSITFGGIPIGLALSGSAALIGAIELGVDIAGCLLGGINLPTGIQIDGGFIIPLLPFGKILDLSLSARGTVSGGVSLGTMGGIPVSSTPTWNEPITPYNAKYPYNRVHESESGHVIEIDDTPGAERLHTYHRSGTFDEIGPTGTKVSKVVANRADITMADHNNYVMGDHNTTVNGRQTTLIQQDVHKNIDGSETNMIKQDRTETILGSETRTIIKDTSTTVMQNRNVNIKGTDNLIIEKDCNITIIGNANITVAGDCQIAVAGSLKAGVTGDANITVGGNVSGIINGIATLAYQHLFLVGDVTLEGNMTVEGSTNGSVGNINVSGSVAATQDVTTGSVSLRRHEHSNVQNGNGVTGPPVA